MSEQSPSILYIAYWGAMEPLGRSLLLPPMRQLSALGASITLITFEKPADLANAAETASVRDGLTRAGVRWIPLRYHKGQSALTKLRDIARGIASGVAAGIRVPPDVIHARTFIGGLIGRAVAILLRKPWIFHAEGFYADEQLDGGVWKQGSRVHRVTSSLEWGLFKSADAVVCLSRRGKKTIEDRIGRNKEVVVVPSCVDLAHFAAPRHNDRTNPLITLIYLGSVGGRYMLASMARFAVVAAETIDVRFRVVTHTDRDLVSQIMRESGLAGDRWEVKFVPHEEVPSELASCDAGLAFVQQGIAVHGCSLTKIGEYWAAGLPVVATANISDTDEIVRQHRVGVILRAQTDDDYRIAARELAALLRDPELRGRCRSAAEANYALEPACREQMTLYSRFVRSSHLGAQHSAI